MIISYISLSITITAEPNESYFYTERSNWSKYVNGTYKGLTHREIRGQFSLTGAGDQGNAYNVTYYILEETLRDMIPMSRQIDDIRTTQAIREDTGGFALTGQDIFPMYRNFPVLPVETPKTGDTWQSEGSRAIDPQNDGNISLLPFLVQYEYIGIEQWQSRQVHRIRAKFATRLSKYNRPRNIDSNLVDAQGTHDLDIIVEAESFTVLLIQDRLDETFSYGDGTTVKFRGSTAIFSDLTARQTTAEVKNSIEATAKESNLIVDKQEASAESLRKTTGEEAFIAEETDKGLRLSMRDIRFKADSAELLESEVWRLDIIANILKDIDNGLFLVEGHTASTGRPEGEKQLSLERAKRIIEELVKRGLKASQFMYLGLGGTVPVKGNANEEERAQNRRVEITILK